MPLCFQETATQLHFTHMVTFQQNKSQKPKYSDYYKIKVYNISHTVKAMQNDIETESQTA